MLLLENNFFSKHITDRAHMTRVQLVPTSVRVQVSFPSVKHACVKVELKGCGGFSLLYTQG